MEEKPSILEDKLKWDDAIDAKSPKFEFQTQTFKKTILNLWDFNKIKTVYSTII